MGYNNNKNNMRSWGRERSYSWAVFLVIWNLSSSLATSASSPPFRSRFLHIFASKSSMRTRRTGDAVVVRDNTSSSTTISNTSKERPEATNHHHDMDDPLDCHSEPGQANTAFFRPQSIGDVNRLHSVESAYLRRSYRPNSPETELEYLESSLFPCSSQSDAQPSSLGRSCEDKDSNLVPLSAATFMHVRGGATGPTVNMAEDKPVKLRPLAFWENMICGAISRSTAQTVMHPLNTMKTMLQNSRGPSGPKLVELLRPSSFRRLTSGAGTNFLLSLPNGALNYAVIEFVRVRLGTMVDSTPFLAQQAAKIGPGLDFMSSCIATVCCSVVSTPQMMITDNIMAGNYPNLAAAVSGLARERGVAGFYAGWLPGMVGKIPSYALTWTFFQQFKLLRDRLTGRPAKNYENTIMGALSSAASVTIMIPVDTIKTRLVTQASRVSTERAYKGILDCAVRVYREEGMGAFYRGLPPRLASVVPLIGLQFTIYEALKRVMLQRQIDRLTYAQDQYGPEQVLKEAAMESAASSHLPMAAPQFKQRFYPHGLAQPKKENGRQAGKTK